jgi:hypothetical protein
VSAAVVLVIAVGTPLFAALVWTVGTLTGWLGVRHRDNPWNWRVLLGPRAYFRWRKAHRRATNR